MTIEAGHIWIGIDDAAAKSGVSVRGLAERAGLHPSSLYKRKDKDGDDAWPTTKTLLATLGAAGMSLEEFGRNVDAISRRPPSSPSASA